MVLSRQDYHWKHEPCLYGWASGAVILGIQIESRLLFLILTGLQLIGTPYYEASCTIRLSN